MTCLYPTRDVMLFKYQECLSSADLIVESGSNNVKGASSRGSAP
jgi:hypothetical protein